MQQTLKLSLFESYSCWVLAPVGKAYRALHKSHDVGTVLHLSRKWHIWQWKDLVWEITTLRNFRTQAKVGSSCQAIGAGDLGGKLPLPLQIGTFFALKEWVTKKLTKQPWQILLWARITCPVSCHTPFIWKDNFCINSLESSGNTRSDCPSKGKGMTEIAKTRATFTETAFHIQVSYYLKATGYGPK